jgi:hypothetical protein
MDIAENVFLGVIAVVVVIDLVFVVAALPDVARSSRMRRM